MLDAADIEAVVGDVCALKTKGREYVCLCPFHDDRNPSMYVVPHKRMYHCFVCGAGGNAIDFVMNYHAMGFREALEHLAERFGVELTRRPPTGGGMSGGGSDASAGVTREDVLGANAFALSFFRALLKHPEHGRAAREAIAARGISDEMVEEFQLGAAPDRYDGLIKTAASRNVSTRSLEGAGLIKRRESGGHYDALRNRLIFPILDQAGRAIAFGGRILNPEDTPKYLNSPETRVFEKGSQLYGLRQAWNAMRAEKVAVVTEGYTDVIACHQAGFRNVVATLGTALTSRHASVLRRAVDRVVLLFDGDEAGQRAADRAVEVFFAEPIDVSIAVLEGGEDPADMLGRGEAGAARFREILDGAADALEYRFGRLERRLDEAGHGIGSQARARLVEEDVARLAELGLFGLSPIRQQAVVRRYAAVAGADEAAVREAVSQHRRGGTKRRPGSAVEEKDPGGPASGGALVPKTPADHAIGAVLAAQSPSDLWGNRASMADSSGGFGDSSGFVDDLRALVKNGAYSSPAAERIAAVIAGWGGDEGPELGLTDRRSALTRLDEESESEDLRGVARSFALHTERLTGGDRQKLAVHWSDCVREVKRLAALQEDSSDSGDIAAALTRRRDAHGRWGGNPRAIPKPRR